VATVVYDDYDPEVEEYLLALVLTNGTDAETDEPVLISSAPFSLTRVDAPTITEVEENGTIEVSYDDNLVVGREVTLTATPEEGYIFGKWEFTLNGELLAYTELNGRDPNQNVNSTEIEFWMPYGDLEVNAVFVNEDNAFAIASAAAEHGAMTVISAAAADADVEITAIPDEGYYLESYTVTGELSEDECTVTFDDRASNVTNRATFNMPNEDVTVTANFEPLTETAGDVATINGVQWAKYNLSRPGEFAGAAALPGLFYQFGIGDVAWSTTGKEPVSVVPADAEWDRSIRATADWDMTADNPCPAGYVVPDKAQADLLTDRVKVAAFAAKEDNLPGYRFVDRASGEYIFLPFVSWRIDSGGVADPSLHPYPACVAGHYWTTAENYDDNIGAGYVSYLNLTASTIRVTTSGGAYAAFGNSVRCVRAE